MWLRKSHQPCHWEWKWKQNIMGEQMLIVFCLLEKVVKILRDKKGRMCFKMQAFSNSFYWCHATSNQRTTHEHGQVLGAKVIKLTRKRTVCEEKQGNNEWMGKKAIRAEKRWLLAVCVPGRPVEGRPRSLSLTERKQGDAMLPDQSYGVPLSPFPV